MDHNSPINTKPTAFEGANSYPYNSLTDREFEELLQSIFELRIQREPDLKKRLTHASLMTGVGERGQDILLTNEGLQVGLIQCKKVNSNLTKPACAQEIIKFGIHAVLDDSIIAPIGIPFTYYLAAAKGFSNPAIELLCSFSKKIVLEKDYQKWVNEVLRNYKSFKGINYPNIAQKLSSVLTRLTVETIVPSKLDLWLSKYPEIVDRFYRVKILDSGAKKYLPETSFQSKMVPSLINERFIAASSTLRNYPAYFDNLDSYHIDRVETSELLAWIKEPLKCTNKTKSLNPEFAPPIAILSGDAGFGKTVVMHDLLLRLIEEGIPTLGIKADKSSFSRRQELIDELQLGDDPEKQAFTLVKTHERVVIIIDQLDTLSQHLSANREPLKMYSRLIDQLASVSNVRIVIACRRYDLQYDPSLTQYQDKHVVALKPLSRENVEKVFAQLQLAPNALTQALYELLSVPLHLNIFSKVYKQVSDYTQLNSVQDLYHELWKQKIINSPAHADTVNSRNVLKLTRRIAMAMYNQQETHVPFRLYETEFSAELSYLSSEGILRVEGVDVEYLHQSFFDYVYARTFVEDGKDLAEEIAGPVGQPKHQGLFVRSQVRQILLYLREVEPRTYQQQVREILKSSTFRFHIKLLVLQSLAFQNVPTPAEQRIVETVVFSEPVLRDAFLESVASSVWLSFLSGKQLIQPLLIADYPLAKKIFAPLCNRVGPHGQSSVIEFMMKLPDFPERYEFMSSILFGSEAFEDIQSLKLVEEVIANQSLGDFYFYHIMEHAIKRFPDWVSQQVWLRLLPELEAIETKATSEDYLPGDRYEFIRMLDKLHESAPEVAIELSLLVLTLIIERTRLERRRELTHDLYNDLAFLLYKPGRASSRYAHQEMDGKLRRWLVELDPNNHAFISQKVELLITQKATSLISIGLQVIHAYPDGYADLFFTLLTTHNFIANFNEAGNDYFRFSVREALRLCFHHFAPEQKQYLTELIINLKPSDEGRIHRYEFFGQQVRKHPVGLAQYELLIVLPNDFITANPDLKGKIQELGRRFKIVKHERPEGVRLMPAPILPDNAYNHMTDEQWISSFIKYDERKGRRWEGVSQLSHAQRFSEEVRKNPARFVALIDQIIGEKDVPDLYVYEGLDGLEKGEHTPEDVKRLLLRAIPRTDEAHYQLRLVWIIRYLLEKNTFDEEVFIFLQSMALTGSQEDTNNGEAIQRGINQTRGASAGPLIKYADQKEYAERVFDTLEESVSTASVPTRAAILYYHVYLNRVDEQRNLNLFIQLCKDHEIELAEVDVQAVQYHIHNQFDLLIPFFEKARTAEDAAQSLTQVLTVAYVFNYPDSERLLDEYLAVSTNNVASAVRYAFDYVSTTDAGHQQKGLTIANRFLDDDRTEIVQSYQHGFDDLTLAHFPVVRTFLFAYVRSKVGCQRDSNFYQYLLKCVQHYPDDCLKLVECFENHEGPDIVHRHLEQEPLEVIIQAYNAYKRYDNPNENLERAMDIFDRMLQIPTYRKEAGKVTDSI